MKYLLKNRDQNTDLIQYLHFLIFWDCCPLAWQAELLQAEITWSINRKCFDLVQLARYLQTIILGRIIVPELYFFSLILLCCLYTLCCMLFCWFLFQYISNYLPTNMTRLSKIKSFICIQRSRLFADSAQWVSTTIFSNL